MLYDTIEIGTEHQEAKKVRGKRKKNHKRHKMTSETAGTSQPHGEETMTNPRLKALILEVVENQIRDGDPPETQQTFERLLATGHARQQFS